MRFLRSRHLAAFMFGALFLAAARPASAESNYTLFESGQVRPLALSTNGDTLYAVNTPDNRLEMFRVTSHGLIHAGSVAVGLEPVAVAVRPNGSEVWVVNHLSDSVSIVDVRNPAFVRVVRTLLVGDEPRDIVFAGPEKSRAFITTAHRGQNSPLDPQLATPGVGRADVWVFDSNNLGNSLGGTPTTILTLFSDTPRALAASPDGSRVYAAAFHSGNRTTTIFESLVTQNWGLPPPFEDAAGEQQPRNSLIVHYDGQHWVDELGRNWDAQVRFSLPDKDVFTIDANDDPPVEIESEVYAGVGTVLFNMVVNPVNGKVYVTNTEANNTTRFEGAPFNGHTTNQGHTVENRITVLAPGQVHPRHLNKHIDFSSCCAEIPNAENAKSLAQPMDMAISSDGHTLYVAAFGSSKVGVYAAAALENDTFDPGAPGSQIPVSGGGPSGVVLDEPRHRLYVLTRFDNAISVIDTQSRTEIAHVPFFNPEPESVVVGRRFLYDASFTSSHGDTSCSSCHIFGDFDSLAWDLGDPGATSTPNPGPIVTPPCFRDIVGDPTKVVCPDPNFRALKGPMTTQSLRGLANHGPMHWRGDRTGTGPFAQPDTGSFDEDEAFRQFNVAFVGLNGRHSELEPQDMEAFKNFIMQLTYPPNPIRNLDNALTPDQQAGRDFFMGVTSNGKPSDTLFTCNVCHVLDPNGNAEFGVDKPGFFGTNGRWSFESESQVFKIPHLRNLYQKVGMFGMAFVPTLSLLSFGFFPGTGICDPVTGFCDETNSFLGDQVRGFGMMHDGAVDTVFRFVSTTLFGARRQGCLVSFDPGNEGGFLPFLCPGDPLPSINEIFAGIRMRRQVEQFLLAFDSNLAPIVGQQITLTETNASTVDDRIALFQERAQVGECDLVVKGSVAANEQGFLYVGAGMFLADHGPLVTDAALRSRANLPGGELTFTCAPPGSGVRMALDRDGDGHWDGAERAAGSSPSNPASTP